MEQNQSYLATEIVDKKKIPNGKSGINGVTKASLPTRLIQIMGM